MTTHKYERRGVMPLIASLLLLTACSKREEPPPDHPRLTARVNMRDVIFHSVALNRDMPYRVVFPASIPAGEKLPVVYLLHGEEAVFGTGQTTPMLRASPSKD